MQPLNTYSLSTAEVGIHRACGNQPPWTPRDNSNSTPPTESSYHSIYSSNNLSAIIRVSEAHKGIKERNKKEISREIESNRKKMGEGGNFFEENKKTWKEMEGSVDSGFRYATNLLYLWPPHVTSPGPSFQLEPTRWTCDI